MEYLENSFFIALLTRFRDFLARLFRGGLFWSFCMACWRKFKGGLFYAFAVGGKKADALWRSSLCYKLLAAVGAIPGKILALPALADSLIVSECRDFAERRAALFIACATALMLVTPQQLWDNMYGLGLAAIALALVAASAPRRGTLRAIGAAPVAFAVCVCMGMALSLRADLSLRFFVFHLTCMAFVLALAAAPRSSAELGRVVLIMSVGVFVASCWAVAQRFIGVEADKVLTDLSVNADMPGRVFSFFENPNSFANVLVLFAPLMLAMALFEKGGAKKLWYALVFLVSCAALLMTYARGGWLSMALAMGVMLLALGPRWAPLCMVAAPLAVPFLPSNILARLLTMFGGGDSSIYTRSYIYTAMRRLIENHPIFGVGLGADAVRDTVYAEGVYEAEALFIHGHNIYLQIWAEMGVFALAAFVIAMAFAVRAGLRLSTDKDPTLRAVGVGAGCALCGSLFFGITDYAWSYPRVMMLFWLLFALIPAAVRLRNIREEN